MITTQSVEIVEETITSAISGSYTQQRQKIILKSFVYFPPATGGNPLYLLINFFL